MMSACCHAPMRALCNHSSPRKRASSGSATRGIRIPKALLDETDLPEEVELYAEPGPLVVEAARRRRSGWAIAATRMWARGDDVLLDESTATKSIPRSGSGGSEPGDRSRPRYLVRLDPTIGGEIKKTRPCVVVSPDELNEHLRTVIVAP
jgi:hypothetical protein